MRGLGGDGGGKEVKSEADIEQGDVVLVPNWIPEVAGGGKSRPRAGPRGADTATCPFAVGHGAAGSVFPLTTSV